MNVIRTVCKSYYEAFQLHNKHIVCNSSMKSYSVILRKTWLACVGHKMFFQISCSRESLWAVLASVRPFARVSSNMGRQCLRICKATATMATYKRLFSSMRRNMPPHLTPLIECFATCWANERFLTCNDIGNEIIARDNQLIFISIPNVSRLPVWVRTWYWKWVLEANPAPQCWQLNGFTPVTHPLW